MDVKIEKKMKIFSLQYIDYNLSQLRHFSRKNKVKINIKKRILDGVSIYIVLDGLFKT